MKYEILKGEEGRTVLQLGLNNIVTFQPDATVDDIVLGVTVLIEKVVGISAFELAKAVLTDMGKINEDGTLAQDG